MQNQIESSLIKSLDLPLKFIQRKIYILHEQEVMLDSDLAELYQVPTKVLNQAIKRNKYRFPADFMFQLTVKEASALRSQIVTLEKGRGRYSKYSPLAFTEHGVAMLSSVLHSKRAIQMNIFIVRAFIQLRKMLATHEALSRRLKKIEGIQKFHGQILSGMVKDIQKINNPPKTNAIGFLWKNKN